MNESISAGAIDLQEYSMLVYWAISQIENIKPMIKMAIHDLLIQ
jgi:hypothetical protein